LDRYQLSFSRGTGRCLGINLAYQELYPVLAGIFRKYDVYDGSSKAKEPTLQLYETDRGDVDIYADFVTPVPKPESQGIRIVVK